MFPGDSRDIKVALPRRALHLSTGTDAPSTLGARDFRSHFTLRASVVECATLHEMVV